MILYSHRRQQKIIIKEKTACVILKDLKNRNLIFSFKYISKNRLVIPNIIILNKKSHLKKFFF